MQRDYDVTATNDNTPLFSRSSIGGKRSADVKARVADELKTDLQRRCHELGVTESDYIERLICVSLYGIDAVIDKERERTKGMLGKLSELWHKVGPNSTP
jgi:hypothetical protein